MNRHSTRPSRPSAQALAYRAFSALRHSLHNEVVSGCLLLFAAAVALIWANSPAAQSYHALWHASLSFGVGNHVFSQTLHFWINDALMTVFFLLVGVEIRREIHQGALSTLRQATLPIAAAIGGVAVPALIYLALNHASEQRQGWAVPTATDIAFAVGVLALLGRSIPANVRILLLALAIIDDIVAVLIIAAVYSAELNGSGLLIVSMGMLLVFGMQRIGVGSAWAYVIPGGIVWLGFLQTGVHPTLAGVVLGLMTPVIATRRCEAPGQLRDVPPPVIGVQSALHPWVAYGIMPIFALANAGVTLTGVDLSLEGSQAVVVGVSVALVLGKPIGIIVASWLVLRLGWCRLPDGVTWPGVCLVGALAGIGFTMSIFIATLAFDDVILLSAAKVGVLAGSLAAGVIGLVWGSCYALPLRRNASSPNPCQSTPRL